MAKDAREQLAARMQRLDDDVDDDLIEPDTAAHIKEIIRAYDSESLLVSKPSGEKYRKPRTLYGWAYILSVIARERDLLTATLDDIKNVLQSFSDGTTKHVDKSCGVANNTLRTYVSALRVFYRYYEDIADFTPEDIPMPKKGSVSVDETDILSKDEIHDLRTASTTPRNNLIVDLLIYTGQRNSALRTLRVKDIDLENETYRYNNNALELKGAGKRNGNRPLLGAINSVRTWILNHHPDSQPEHYLITQEPSYHNVTPDEPVSKGLLRRAVERIRPKTNIDKPLNPHNFRHTFVTVCKRDYKMDNDTIKYLIGHSKNSNVMETTYSHLTGDDYSDAAKEAFGLKDPDEQSSLTPEFCDVCAEPLEPTAKACGNCGTIITPDAKSAQDRIDDGKINAAKEVMSNTDTENYDDVISFINNNEEMFREIMRRQQE